MLTPVINRLPVELLTYIIRLANASVGTPWGTYTHPYLSYTWVCHHWRAVLIQSPVFWTMISPQFWQRSHLEIFDHELLRRTKSAKLDVSLSSYRSTSGCDTFLKDLFKEGSRIRTLALLSYQDEIIQLISSAKHFPSLQMFASVRRRFVARDYALSHLLPILVASNHLETFECTLPTKGWDGIQKYLAVILGRLRNLSLKIYSPAVAQSVLDLLFNNNTKLQKLQLIMDFVYETYEDTETTFSGQAIFPELHSLSINNLLLLGCFQAPKLSGLITSWDMDSCTLDYPILDGFNFSSIRYLYIQSRCWQSSWGKGYCIIGSKDHLPDCSETSYAENVLFDDILSRVHPRGYFHLRFRRQSAFAIALRTALSSIIPRLTSLIELHLLFPQTHSVCREIIPRVPSIQKLTVGPGNDLIGFPRLLSNSQCPQLSYLSYTTFPSSENLKEYADNVGRNLTNCLRSRQNNSSGNALKYINLINCPPLPNNWLEELQKLGAEVITEKDFKSVKTDKCYTMPLEWTKI